MSIVLAPFRHCGHTANNCITLLCLRANSDFFFFSYWSNLCVCTCLFIGPLLIPPSVLVGSNTSRQRLHKYRKEMERQLRERCTWPKIQNVKRELERRRRKRAGLWKRKRCTSLVCITNRMSWRESSRERWEAYRNTAVEEEVCVCDCVCENPRGDGEQAWDREEGL